MGNGPSGKRHRQQAYAPISERQTLPSRQPSHRVQRANSEENVIEEEKYLEEDPVPRSKQILVEASHHSPAPVVLPGQIHDDEPEMEAGLARDLQDVHFFAGTEDIVDWEALSGPACRGAVPMLVELESMQRCDRWLWRPLHYAAIYGSVEAIDLLVKAGATVDARTGGHARMGANLTKASFNFAAHLECRFGNKNLAVNVVEVNGDMVTITPPHSKAMQIIPVTQCICAGYNTGQQPHHVARFGYATPLHVAVEFQHTRAIRALLSHRADPNTSWNEGSDRPLHTAVLQGSEETVSLLLRARADPNSEDAWGRVPLILGATCHQAPPRNIAQMLLDAGAHQAVTDKSGKTAAQLARESGHNEYADAVELYDINERADIKAKRMAEERAKKEAEESARILAEERAIWEAQERAKREALEQARRAAEEEARRAAEEEARHRAEEARLRQLREEQARRDAEERARLEAEERARRQAEEERARQEAEERARREAEARARQEEERRWQEEEMRRQEEERARQEAEEAERRARLEAEEAERRARLDAEERARLEAEQKEAEEKARLEAEEKARLEAEEKARLEAEERARLEAEEQARQEELARHEAEEKARLEAEERARQEAEEQARVEADEKARQEEEEKARQEAEEQSRREAEETARREESEKAEEQAKLGRWLTALALHTVVGTMNRRREAWHREFAKVRSDRWDRAIARPPLDSTTGRMIASSGRADLLRAGGLVKEATKLEKDLERKGQNLEKLRTKWKRMAELSDMSPEEATTIMVREFGYDD